MIDRRRLIAGSAAGLLLAGRASAQTVKKPVHIIVGFPAGGGTDVTARVLAEALRGAYASAVLVENKPGASARIAVDCEASLIAALKARTTSSGILAGRNTPSQVSTTTS